MLSTFSWSTFYLWVQKANKQIKTSTTNRKSLDLVQKKVIQRLRRRIHFNSISIFHAYYGSDTVPSTGVQPQIK